MNAEDRTRWLEPSRPIAIDGLERHVQLPKQAPEKAPQRLPLRLADEVHSVRVRDLRQRFADPEVFAAECSCGWNGEPRTGVTAERVARRDGRVHIDQNRPPYGHRGRPV